MQMDNVRKPISSNMSTNHSRSQILVRRNKEISQKQLLVLNQRYIQNTTQPPHSGQDSNKLRQIDVAEICTPCSSNKIRGRNSTSSKKSFKRGGIRSAPAGTPTYRNWASRTVRDPCILAATNRPKLVDSIMWIIQLQQWKFVAKAANPLSSLWPRPTLRCKALENWIAQVCKSSPNRSHLVLDWKYSSWKSSHCLHKCPWGISKRV